MRKIKIILMFILVILVFFSVPVYFIGYYEAFGNFMIETLGINISPALSGGEVMAVFNDSYYDDKGTGSYTYSEAEVFQPYSGHLDILKYIVKKPVHGKAWNDVNEFWAMEVVMGSLTNPLKAPAGFSFPVINIYISIDGKEGGSIKSLFPGVNIAFDPEHPWHYVVTVNGWEVDGKLYNSNGEYVDRVLIDIIKKKDREDRLRFTVPIEKAPELYALTEKDTTYHYVLTGSYDPVESGNFRSILQKESKISGGGNPEPEIAPMIYDYLAPDGMDQYKILSGYNSKKQKYAVLKPVKVSMGVGVEKKEIVKQLTEEDEKKYEISRKTEVNKSIDQLEKALNDNIDEETMTMLAVLYFQNGENEQAEILLKKILQNKDVNNSAALAYLGAITAKKAADAAGNIAKMRILAEAMTMLDKAAADVKSDSIDVVHVLMCRANVYSIIPDIYNKTDTVIADMEKLTVILADSSLNELKADAAIMLGGAYARKRMFKAAVDQYHSALKTVQNEYYSKKLKDKIAEAELLYLDKIITNL